MKSHDFGRAAEAAAAAYLERRGWRILERNYRFGHREIDIIAESAGVIAFIEVKARSGRNYGHPLEAITALKRREIEAVARRWLAQNAGSGKVLRFDAMAVRRSASGQMEIDHVEDAWRRAAG